MDNAGKTSSQVFQFKLFADAIQEEFKQIFYEAFQPLHKRLDRIENKEVKRRSSMQSTSTKPTYSRRKEIPLVSSKSKVEVEPSKEESWWET